MLKQLPPYAIDTLLDIFNACTSLGTIPKAWKHSLIYPISKKQKFEGELNQIHPITLIEHIQKIFRKILTNRLNQILLRYPILSPFNYVALPYTSTAQPIQYLTNILEDAYINNKEFWIPKHMILCISFCFTKLSSKSNAWTLRLAYYKLISK